MAEWHMLPSWLPPTYVPECLLLACWGLGLATLWPLCSSQLRRPVTDVEPQRRFGPLRRILAVRIGSPRRISDCADRQRAKALAPVVVTPAAIVAILPNGECRYLNVVLASFKTDRQISSRLRSELFCEGRAWLLPRSGMRRARDHGSRANRAAFFCRLPET